MWNARDECSHRDPTMCTPALDDADLVRDVQGIVILGQAHVRLLRVIGGDQRVHLKKGEIQALPIDDRESREAFPQSLNRSMLS